VRRHGSAKELLVGFRKKATGEPSITWPEAVDQALCFGWIDGVRRKIDDRSYSVRFTPRKPGSRWSAVNIARVEALKAEGLMKTAGIKALEQRTEAKSRTYSYERAKAPALDAALAKPLKANKAAWTFMQEQAPSYQRKVVHWVMSAKSQDTRVARLRRAIAAFESGRRL
jgi:uncharacterized protein YdeI (YjbR/CyaY-like superfamily)